MSHVYWQRGRSLRKWKDNPELGLWCHIQRNAYTNDKLSPDRVTRLEKLGFVWDPLTAAWEEMFAELVAYKQTHGDCNVPRYWNDNPFLGNWCHTQRRTYKSNKLSPNRFKRLDEIGFVWRSKKRIQE